MIFAIYHILCRIWGTTSKSNILIHRILKKKSHIDNLKMDPELDLVPKLCSVYTLVSGNILCSVTVTHRVIFFSCSTLCSLFYSSHTVKMCQTDFQNYRGEKSADADARRHGHGAPVV
jgi:hypothetical protein